MARQLPGWPGDVEVLGMHVGEGGAVVDYATMDSVLAECAGVSDRL
ncbi:hypothetical protein [Nocardia suismassiliense]|nr:hypothetical protein [Nocardia suismassiliense]